MTSEPKEEHQESSISSGHGRLLRDNTQSYKAKSWRVVYEVPNQARKENSCSR